MKLMNTRFVSGIAALAAITLSSTASAVPLAASVSSSPLVVGGVVVGLGLLVAFVFVMMRSFRTMRSASVDNRVETAVHQADALVAAFRSVPSPEVLRTLVDELRESQTDEERLVFARALSTLTQRHFGTDDVAWEVWLRRDAASFLKSVGHESNSDDSTALPVS
jgi:hypothetical protein